MIASTGPVMSDSQAMMEAETIQILIRGPPISNRGHGYYTWKDLQVFV